MSRYLLLLTALLSIATFAYSAEPYFPRGIVMSYECKQIDQKVTGFSCEFNEGKMRLQWHKDPESLSGEERELALYEFSKIQLRFLNLGGKSFDVGFDHWPEGAVKTCTQEKGHAWHKTWCVDYGR